MARHQLCVIIIIKHSYVYWCVYSCLNFTHHIYGEMQICFKPGVAKEFRIHCRVQEALDLIFPESA